MINVKERLNQDYVKKIEFPEKAYWISDEGCPNLRLYVGLDKKVWYVCYRQRGSDKKQSYKIGSTDVYTVAQARDEAKRILAEVLTGKNPKQEILTEAITLEDFLNTYYRPYVTTSLKTGKETMDMIDSSFGFLMKKPIEDIKMLDLDKWRNDCRNGDSKTGKKNLKKASTVNRLIAALRSALN